MFFDVRFFDKLNIPLHIRRTQLPFYEEETSYADFLRFVFLNHLPRYQTARRVGKYARHTFYQLFSTPRVNSEEDKTNLLLEILYFEFNCYGYEVEVWEIKYDPGSQVFSWTSKENPDKQSSQPSSRRQKKNSQVRNPEQHSSSPSCHLCFLDIHTVTKAADVHRFKFVYTFPRWSLTKHRPSHAMAIHF